MLLPGIPSDQGRSDDGPDRLIHQGRLVVLIDGLSFVITSVFPKSFSRLPPSHWYCKIPVWFARHLFFA
jgi:hypothetical protein